MADRDEFVAAVVQQGVPDLEAAAAVSAIRMYCGWHVIPPRPDATVLGPGGHHGHTPEEAADVVLVARAVGLGAAAAVRASGVEQEQVESAMVRWTAGAQSGALTVAHRSTLDLYRRPPLA